MKRRSGLNILFYILLIFNILIYSNLLYQVFYKTTEEPDITSAHPISQQKIGDEADPDILIIYEAEVDGETVYPTVIKEAK